MVLYLQEYINRVTNPKTNKLYYYDLIRLSKQIKHNIFTNVCVPYPKAVFKLNNKNYNLARVIYNNFKSDITTNDQVRHTCTTKGCITLKHLYKVVKKCKHHKELPIKLSVSIIYRSDELDDRLIIRFD